MDDYNNSIGTHGLIESGNWTIGGLLGKAWEQNMSDYQTWQGTYVSCIIMPLHPGIFGEEYYCIGAWLLLLNVFIAIYYFVATIWKIMGIKEYKITLSVFLFVAIFQWMPSIVQGLYWFNGAWYYMFMFALCLVNFAFILRYFVQNKIIYIILSSILSFIISGGNQVSSFLNILILVFICVYEWILKKKVYCGFSLFTACVGWLIMFLAPGTACRQSVYTKQGIIETIIHGGAIGAFLHLRNWMSSRWGVFLILLIPVAIFIKRNTKCTKKIIFHPLCLLAIAMVVLCGQLCVPYYAEGSYGPLRLSNIIWIYFMFSSGALWIYIIVYYSDRIKWNKKLVMIWEKINSYVIYLFQIIMVLGTCVYCFHGENNGMKSYRELSSGLAQEYAKEFDMRIELLEQSDGHEKLRVNVLPESEILKPYDLSSDYDDWRNVGWYLYYGTQIAVDEESDVNK